MMTFRLAAILVMAVLVAGAHHAFSVTYDPLRPATLTGRVDSVRWQNPHVYVVLDAEAQNGRTERWVIEGYAPGLLTRQGWSRDSIRAGSRISVSGWPARDTATRAFSGREITLENGMKSIFGPTPEEGDMWQCKGTCDPLVEMRKLLN